MYIPIRCSFPFSLFLLTQVTRDNHSLNIYDLSIRIQNWREKDNGDNYTLLPFSLNSHHNWIKWISFIGTSNLLESNGQIQSSLFSIFELDEPFVIKTKFSVSHATKSTCTVRPYNPPEKLCQCRDTIPFSFTRAHCRTSGLVLLFWENF